MPNGSSSFRPAAATKPLLNGRKSTADLFVGWLRSFAQFVMTG
jgi:hypothetical protein